MQEVSASELLAILSHSDLKEGQAVIRVGGKFIVAYITSINLMIETGGLPEVNFSGYIRKED